jgi:hypothetical protein
MIRRQPQGDASQACLSCKKQKRKCDKGLPACVLCKRFAIFFLDLTNRSNVLRATFRIGRSCRYEISELSNTTLNSNGNFPLTTAFDLDQYSKPSIHLTIKQQAGSIIGSDLDVQASSMRYFNTIHAGFPVIKQTEYLSRLPHTADTYPDQLLLSVCMLLLTTFPEKDELSSWSRSVYVFLKGAIGLLESSGAESIVLLKSRLLLAVFEVAHGLYPAAYISIGTVARTAATLNLHRDCNSSLNEGSISFESKEESELIWRGVLILDRCVIL